MEYRKLPRGEEKISVLGVGTSSIGMAEERRDRSGDKPGSGEWNQLLRHGLG